MTLALLAAMPEELQALLPLLGAARVHHHAGREFHSGRLDGRELVLACSPPGPVAVATTTTLLIERFGAEAVLATGVAGGLHPRLRIGDVVVVRELLRRDALAAPLFARADVPADGRARLLTDPELGAGLFEAARAALEVERIALAGSLALLGITVPQVHEGPVLCAEQPVTAEAERVALSREWPEALAVDTDGAALAEVCHDCDLPYALLRCIADRADEQAPGDRRRFVAQVAGPLAAAVVRAWLWRQDGGDFARSG